MASALCSCYEEKKLSKQRKRGGSGVFFIGIVKKGSQKERKKLENNTLGLLLEPTAQNRHFLCAL